MKRYSLEGYMKKTDNLSDYLKWELFRNMRLSAGICKLKTHISTKSKERKKVRVTIEEIPTKAGGE